MKFIIYAILSALILISCEKDELITNAGADGSSALKTKTLFEPSPIDQLEGLAVNIKLVSPMPNNYNYISTNTKNNMVDRHSVDDGSLRQRWYITRPNINGMNEREYLIKIVGGAKYNGFLVHSGISAPFSVVIGSEYLPTLSYLGIKNLPNTSNYNIFTTYGLAPAEKVYLYANGSGRELIFGKINNLDQRAIWEIIPVEDYEFVEAKYIPVLGEKFKPTPVVVTTKTIHNNSSAPLNYSTKFSEEVTESSTFSKTEGLSVTDKITVSAKVGLPVITAEGSISTEYTTTKNWSYQESNTLTNKRIMEDNISITIPPPYILFCRCLYYHIRNRRKVCCYF